MKVCVYQYDMVDVFCWCYYGYMQGVIEQVLQVNLGLVEYGLFLLYGLQVELLDIMVLIMVQIVQLWD